MLLVRKPEEKSPKKREEKTAGRFRLKNDDTAKPRFSFDEGSYSRAIWRLQFFFRGAPKEGGGWAIPRFPREGFS
jgi:hypothetical protein